MRNLWVRFGCFLTGYNYQILQGCSEAAFKAVKKYTAAMLIVCILWFFIGFTFAQRYLGSSIGGSVAAGIIAIIIIVQVEKQIILSIHPGKWLLIFRFCLAFMMSILGAVIIDQILLEKDIELEKVSYNSKRVDLILPSKTAELRSQIMALDTTINNKEEEKKRYIDDIGIHPTIPIITTQVQKTIVQNKVKGSTGRDSTIFDTHNTNTVIRGSMPNPKLALIQPIDSAIGAMRQQKARKENDLLHIRPELERELKEKTGFLDELKVMVQLISGSYVALCFWLLWILFFLFIEMLVLFSKMGDKSSDYEKAVLHHMNLRMRRLDLLAKGLEDTPSKMSLNTNTAN
ncbi:DUF4407 domain-containing protein [Paraflavitalea soli]|uniref:DUF4407 domain-containing protein n=1 Tax=Paraflavitalea soli TaxID=2315862 RepID=A0A3B7MKH2_9BACT|nr:DUF4407 domain-containing protein [Paraflavitalea soli]AXY73610.1 DUF4407 domain-containing protein [Paraflavitalea soli]